MNSKNTTEKFSVYISLRTNLGERLGNLELANQMLAPLVQVIDKSPIYQTPPWGFVDQPDFLNQVILGETIQQPADLLIFLKYIEIEVGRKPTFKYGPRVVDLDILFYDDSIINSDGLQIPHPRLHERAFVLVPLFDLNPDLRHPVFNKTVQELLQNVDTSGITKFSL